MTVLASTPDHLAEYEAGARLLTITRRTDGHCVALTGARVAGEFRDCLRTHAPERVIQTFLRIAGGAGADWTPLYKPEAVQPGGRFAHGAASCV